MAETRFLYVHRDDIRTWQLATLAVQQEIQNVFVQNEIPGWCGGGTLIGAVRNKGFLYWDNDLDMFFCHDDYKRILYSFWQIGFLKKYDLYYNVNGYWEKHERLMQILTADEFDEVGLDFELEELSKTMFKIFSRESVPVKYFENDKDDPETYVRVKHFVNNHVTRYRKAHQNDSVKFSETYLALPDVCMLPMVRIRYGQYLLSNLFFLFYRLAMLFSVRLEASFDRIIRSKSYHYRIDGQVSARGDQRFDPAPFDPMTVKVKTVISNLSKLIAYSFLNLKRKFTEGLTGELIVYRQAFFRFLVLPYYYEDIFPLTKIPFDDKEIFVPTNYLKILTTQFGDYDSEPPVEQRMAYPFFLEGRMDSWPVKKFIDKG